MHAAGEIEMRNRKPATSSDHANAKHAFRSKRLRNPASDSEKLINGRSAICQTPPDPLTVALSGRSTEQAEITLLRSGGVK